MKSAFGAERAGVDHSWSVRGNAISITEALRAGTMNESTDVGVTDAASPHGARQAHEFLQTVVDALPDALVVIDREYNIILANRAARVRTGLADARPNHCKCYRYFHHRELPCVNRSCELLAPVDSCPVAKVFDTKSPMRDYHTHYERGWQGDLGGCRCGAHSR